MTDGPGPPPLAVLDTGVAFDGDGVAYATVVLDVGGRPDVADLARVHAVEGIGDLVTSLEPVPGGLTLHVRLDHPVRARFGVAFELPAHRPVLDHAAITGALLLATTAPEGVDPGREHPNPLWLAVDLDGERLAALVALLDGPGPP
jgi:hypothetical protein